MVTKTRTRKPQVKVKCGCGAMIGSAGQLMHETSKAHRAWAATEEPEASVVDTPVEEPMDETLVAALDAARRGEDPRNVAKMVRTVYNRKEWPNMVDFLAEHNIPILTYPSHVDPDEARAYTDAFFQDIKARGYGTDRWEII